MDCCCDQMRYFISKDGIEGEFNTDDIIYYSPQFDEYGIVVHDSGKSYIIINYCPFCGKKLPNSKRDLWFEELEKLGIDEPFENEIPEVFNSCAWWKKETIQQPDPNLTPTQN